MTSQRVTILCPYHNRENFVERTLASISSQTYKDFVAIVWDDCSADGTWKEIQRIASELNDERIRTYRHPVNIGLTKGLNWALEQASTDYVAIVGSGDECHPERIERQVAALDASPQAVFCATASTTSDPITGAVFIDSHFSRPIITHDDVAERCPFTHGSVMYRTEALHRTGRYQEELKWCADWDMFFRILRQGHAVYLEDILYKRVAQVDGASFSPEKSLDQIFYKHLALRLSRLDDRSRQALLTAVRSHGVRLAMAGQIGRISRDLARRNVKLYFLRRPAAGDKMAALARSNRIQYPLVYRIALRFGSIISKLPIQPNTLIQIGRLVPKRLN